MLIAALVILIVAAVGGGAIGCRYLFAGEFMRYQEQVVGQPWSVLGIRL